jgi:hypothetical protein
MIKGHYAYLCCVVQIAKRKLPEIVGESLFSETLVWITQKNRHKSPSYSTVLIKIKKINLDIVRCPRWGSEVTKYNQNSYEARIS